MGPYKNFVPSDSTKLNLFNCSDPVKNRASSIDKGEKAKEKVVAPVCAKITLPKESIKTQKLTNGPNLITQSEAPAPEVIVMNKLWTDLSINSVLAGETRASVTPEKRIPRKKRNIKSLATSPPRKYPIPNQYKNTLGLQKDQCLPPHIPPFPLVFKSLRNEANDYNPETTDTSRTDKYDMPRTNWDDSIENVKSMIKTNDDDKYKEGDLRHQHGNESVINKTK